MSNLDKKLNVIDTVKDGISIGIKNIGPILVNIILWLLTVWIPYLNVGTTIGLVVGIVSKASKDETIPFTEIFNPIYRKYMGEFFISSGLVGLGVAMGMFFFIIPGIVIGLAWCLTLLLVIDKRKNPTEAISLSNNCTYGNKFRIFGVYFLVGIVFTIALLILALIPFLGVLFVLAGSIFMGCTFIGLQASIYKQLTAKV